MIGKRLLFTTMAPALAAVLLLTLGDAGVAEADTTFTVTKTADTFDNVCGSDCSLREAVVEANRTPGTDTIVLGSGTYTLSIPGCTGTCSPVDDETTGDLDFRSNIVIVGNGARNTTIDASNLTPAGPDTRVFDTIGAGAINVTLVGLTIQNGNTTEDGGGIQNRTGSTLALNDVTVENNDAALNGAGIYNEGELIIQRSTTRRPSTVAASPTWRPAKST
ncbi:MAG: CSLREA domain-containing protein [Dehalococcoidia bacterium]|nr:CSLREA domain-containing protein [Dehalococcoidia bacterium]